MGAIVRNSMALAAGIAALAAYAAPATAFGCESWRGDSEIRCLGQNADLAFPISQAATVRNISSVIVSFQVQQWASTCGFPGQTKGAPETVTLNPDASMDFVIQTAAAGGLGPSCTELFVFNCRANNVGLPCRNYVSAVLGPAGSFPFTPPFQFPTQ